MEYEAHKTLFNLEQRVAILETELNRLIQFINNKEEEDKKSLDEQPTRKN